MSADAEDDLPDSGSKLSKKKPKKKYYPFGTPSHSRHPFSAFAHLSVDNINFAVDLASATGIEPEIVSEDTHTEKKIIRKSTNKNAAKSSHSVEDTLNDIPNTEGLEPCARPACLQILKLIVDTQLSNLIEKDEIEEEYERLEEELRATEADVLISETKLQKLNELGNQLETKLNQLMVKVEGLDKTKDFLNGERSDINNKIMVLESEKQKSQRKLEQATKSLSDAMWRKKKQEHQVNVEAGLSLEASSIADSRIIHTDQESIDLANDVSFEKYNRLSRVEVVDNLEQPPKILTIPDFLQEKILYEPFALDKYSKTFYYNLAKSSCDSIERLQQLSLTGIDRVPNESIKRPKMLITNSSNNSRISVSSSFARTRVGELLRSRNDELLSSTASAVIEKSEQFYTNYRPNYVPGGSVFMSSSKSEALMSAMRKNKCQVRLTPMEGNLEVNSSADLGSYSQNRTETKDRTSSSYQPNSSFSTIGMHSINDSSSFKPSSTKLHPVFFKESARNAWGREKPVGKMRIANYDPLYVDPLQHYDVKIGKDDLNKKTETPKSNKPILIGIQPLKVSLDSRPMALKSRSLTTNTIGMDAFNGAATM
eukprot:gene6577-9043_t